MKCFSFTPAFSEDFKVSMAEAGWQLIHQDAGQTHLVGWGYVMTWSNPTQDVADVASEQVTLRYTDQQGQAEAILEVTDAALTPVQNLLTRLGAPFDRSTG